MRRNRGWVTAAIFGFISKVASPGADPPRPDPRRQCAPGTNGWSLGLRIAAEQHHIIIENIVGTVPLSRTPDVYVSPEAARSRGVSDLTNNVSSSCAHRPGTG